MKRFLTCLSLLTLVAMAAACGSTANNKNDDVVPADGIEGDGSLTGDALDGIVVETTLSKTTTAAGEAVTVTCTVTKDGKELKLDTWISVSVEEDEYQVTDDQLVVMAVGTFDVTCSVADSELTDETPASLTVTSGPATKVTTKLEAANITAGDEIVVTCEATDEWNNPVDAEFELQITPEGCDVAGLNITGKKSGSYQVACAVRDTDVADDSPETLVVKAGQAVKIVTELAQSTINAGEETTVTCIGTDAQGNEVSDPMTVEAPEAVEVTGKKVYSEKAGIWEITCVSAGAPGAETESADLTVNALEAVGLALKLTPGKPVYQRNDKVTVGYSLVDKFANPIPGGEIDIPTVTPVEGTEHPSDFQFKFLAQGKYTFYSCVVGDSTKCDDIEAWVDDTSPLIVVDYPERGMTLNGNTTVNATGSVTEDVSELAIFRINGVDVVVDEFGHFNQPLMAVQGMNLLAFHAEDIFGNKMDTFRSFYFSQTWYNVDNANPQASQVPRSAMIYVDDTLFYNPDPNDQANITALLSGALSGLDLSTLLPSPVTSLAQIGCEWDVYVTNIQYEPPTIMAQTVDGGLGLVLQVKNFSADVELDKTKGLLCPSVSGKATAQSIDVKATILIYIDGATGKLHVAMGETTVDFVELDIALNGLASLLNFIVDLFKGTLTDMLVEQVNTALGDVIVDLDATIQDFLGKPIVLPIDPLIPGMNQVTLNINVFPSLSQFNPMGGLIEAGLSITADKLIDRNPLGSIGRGSCLSPTPENFQLDLNNPEKIMLALFDDILSEALFSFWWNRGTHLQITSETLAEMGTDLSEYAITDLIVNSYPMLPPIVTGCLPGELATVQLGDFYVEAEFTMLGKPVDLHMYLYLQLDIEPGIITDEEGKKISLNLNMPSIVEVDIVYINDVWKGKESTFVGLVKDTLIPMALEDVVADPPSFAIPSFNLAGLLGDDPESPLPIQLPNKDLVIDLKSIVHKMGYLQAAAGLLLQDPVVEPPVE